MKKTIFAIAVASTLMSGIIFPGCENSDTKVKSGSLKTEEVKQEINISQQDTNALVGNMAKDKEWKIFKSKAEVKINYHSILCTELRRKMSISSKKFDLLHPKRIADLEVDNKELKSRLSAFEWNQDQLEVFMYKFNHDINELGRALNDLNKVN